MTAKKRQPFFERLKKGLEECIAHAKGDLTLRTTEFPDSTPNQNTNSEPSKRTKKSSKG
ncbi:MAG: hypothetical protein WEB58_16445 [Planctomycetaceae bacterium]